MVQVTEFGKEIGKQLIDLNKPQTWLIKEVRKRTGRYFDSSYLHKLKTGKNKNAKMIQAIREILNM